MMRGGESMKKINMKKIIISLLIVIVLGIGIYAGIYYSQPENAPLMASWAIDIYDHEVMVEDSENVFIGTVESVDGNKKHEGTGIPCTIYQVKVDENIKGELNGVVKIVKEGGYDGRTLFLHDGDKLLEEGKTYMFCTKYSEEEAAHYASAPTSTIEIQDEKHREEMRDTYKAAYEKELNEKIQ